MPDSAPPSPSFRQLLGNIAGALRLSWGASPRAFVFTSLATAATGVISPLAVWLTKRLVDLTVTRVVRFPVGRLVRGVPHPRTFLGQALHREKVWSSPGSGC